MTLNHNGEFDTYHSDVDSNHFLGMDLFLQVLSKFTFTRISVAVTINSIYPTLPPKIRKYKHEMCRKYKCEMCKNLDTIYSYTISIDISCWFWNHKCWLYRLILWGGPWLEIRDKTKMTQFGLRPQVPGSFFVTWKSKHHQIWNWISF